MQRDIKVQLFFPNSRKKLYRLSSSWNWITTQLLLSLAFFPPLFHNCWAQKHFLINIQHINFGIRIWSLEKPTVTLSNNNESDFYPGEKITAKIMLLLFSRSMSVLYQWFYHNILSFTNSIHQSVSFIFHWINFSSFWFLHW